MAKQEEIFNRGEKEQEINKPIKYLNILLVIAYGYITVLTPNMQALDSNGPKFMTLAFLNLLTFLFLFTRKEVKTNPDAYFVFFRNYVGIAYSLLMVVSLLSFFKAINVLESVLHFSKVFTTFTAAYLVSILILTEKRSLLFLSVAMSFLLIFDSLTVFVGISKYIEGDLLGPFNTIYDIMGNYSHKNIFSAAIFIKIPFALWLIIFQKKIARILGIFALLMGQLALFFLAARTFYLGMFATNLALAIFFIYRYSNGRDKIHLKLLSTTIVAFLLAILVFSLIQKILYPKSNDRFATSVSERIATINAEGGEAKSRLEAWKRSLHLIEKEPLLGVGLGNWKVASLKEENFYNKGFILQYKAHNDFIETTSETGIFGGLLFISMFILSVSQLLIKMRRKASREDINLTFLYAFGLFYYSFDAFFNFPQDRPEIASLFAIYIGIAISNMPNFILFRKGEKYYFITKTNVFNHSIITRYLKIMLGSIFLISTCYILVLNFKSLKNQFIVFNEIKGGKLSSNTNQIINNFPRIPNLNAVGEPISVQKARYLIKDERYNEVINLLERDNSSPYDGRKEFFISQAYLAKNQIDSSINYAERLREIKPLFFLNIQHLCKLYLRKDEASKGKIILNKFLETNKYDGTAWLYSYSYFLTIGDVKKAVSLLDSAAFYMPKNKQFTVQKENLGFNQDDIFFDKSFENALEAYNNQEFDVSAKLFSLIVDTKESCNECRIKRAFCYYSMQEYGKSIDDLEYLISIGIKLPNIYNLLGVNYYLIGKKDEACSNFELAMKMGDQEGKINFNKYCVVEQKK